MIAPSRTFDNQRTGPVMARSRRLAPPWGIQQRARDDDISTDALWSSWSWLLRPVCQYRALASSPRPSAMAGVGTRGGYERLPLTLGQSVSENPCDEEAIRDASALYRRHRRPDRPGTGGIKFAPHMSAFICKRCCRVHVKVEAWQAETTKAAVPIRRGAKSDVSQPTTHLRRDAVPPGPRVPARFCG